MSRLLPFLWCVIALTGRADAVLLRHRVATAQDVSYVMSYVPGNHDAHGRFMGGTELRVLTTHTIPNGNPGCSTLGGCKVLFAANGYWEDPSWSYSGGAQAQILALYSAGGRWVQDFGLPPPTLAAVVLYDAHFTTSGNSGSCAPVPEQDILVTSGWNVTRPTAPVIVYARNDATATWSGTTIDRAPYPAPSPPEVRSMMLHHDNVTGCDLLFAGDNPSGIFTGYYDGVPGHVSWNTSAPEFSISGLGPWTNFPSSTLLPRVMSMADCTLADGLKHLFMTVGPAIYERTDGASPWWTLVYTYVPPASNNSQSGLRGLHCIPNPNGAGQVVLTVMEGFNKPSNDDPVIRFDPNASTAAVDLNMGAFVAAAWGGTTTYMIGAYNDMTDINGDVYIGFESFVPLAGVAPGHTLYYVGGGVKYLDSQAWYLVRDRSGAYHLYGLPLMTPYRAMVSVRDIRVSPFGDNNIYFAGFDANIYPAHNSSWIVVTGGAVQPMETPGH